VERLSGRSGLASDNRAPVRVRLATHEWLRSPGHRSECVVLGRGRRDGRVTQDDLSVTPPATSIPRDSGVTSSSSISLVISEPPPRIFACTAAPSATTSSGFRPVCGTRLNRSCTRRRTLGMRVEPPTSTTSSICSGFRPASLSACLQGPMVRSMMGWIICPKPSSEISRRYFLPPGKSTSSFAVGCEESAIFASLRLCGCGPRFLRGGGRLSEDRVPSRRECRRARRRSADCRCRRRLNVCRRWWRRPRKCRRAV